ncbi:undecaprenyl-diphosphate phosphatase [Parahaliea mediterranea]|uniref:Undecaprenyl-diphosphatase n=1 Tax=Parahaliea mediterranea TaxID=651086 RepID=A0A939DIM8_9GAMM|nr:undecaprenyl-diphosphate phosphatase [Parahaliea mediterranea]MBN7798162.1 undecaprenyl-diphosphate phosphatase [Parahaliea mediterranea]
MEPLQALVLALLQGLTEFLPISSSAHLVIPSLVLGWPDQGLAFDVAVHVGTLAAVVIFYRRDLMAMAGGCLGMGAPEASAAQRRLVVLLALATVPAVLFGFAGDDFIESHLRSLPVIATTTLVFGLLLGLAEWRAPANSVQLTWRLALLVGLAQAVALVPGVSRSGVTITAAVLLGLSRPDAARFSFLMSIPVIAGAGLLKTLDLLEAPSPVDWFWLGVASLVAGITAYACIRVFLGLLERIGLMPFVYYRVILSLLLYAIWIA